MKKIFYLLLTVAFMFSLTACSAADNESNQTMQKIGTVAEQFEEIVDILASMGENSSDQDEALNQNYADSAASEINCVLDI